MKNLLKWGGHDYTLAYVYARGYYDGRNYGYEDTGQEWMTDEERHIYQTGYERGVSDYCEIDELKQGEHK